MKEWSFRTGSRGVDLQVCEWGEGSPTTIILHGFLEQGAAWDAVASKLPGTTFAPDQRGHGRSSHVGDGGFYHFFDYVADLDSFINYLGTPVHLVGHSMGGSVACYFAGARPEHIQRLILVEGLGPPDRSDNPVGTARQHLNDRLNPKQHPVFQNLDEAASRLRRVNTALDPTTALALASRLTRPVESGYLSWSWDTLHRARNAQPFNAKPFMAFLKAIKAPTLLVRGANSRFIVNDYSERKNYLRDAREVVIEDAGHLVHHDNPGELTTVINNFLVESR